MWVHTDEYLIIVKGVDIPSMMMHCVLNKMLLLEDSAAARMSQGVQNFLSRKIPLYITGGIRPSTGPALSPCNSSKCSVIEKWSESHAYAIISKLKNITRKWQAIQVKRGVRSACSSSQGHNEGTRNANGVPLSGSIEHRQ